MVKIPIATATFITDTIKFLKNDLLGAITDPIQSSRPSTSKFVMTSYPKRAAVYPLITVVDSGIADIQRGGMRSEIHIMRFPVEIRVWARNVVERDTLSQQVFNRLRNNQFGTGSSDAEDLHDFSLGVMINIDDPGEQGLRTKAIEVSYMAIVGG